MNSYFEILNGDNENSFNIFLNKITDFPIHWHQALEIILVLEGEMIVNIAGKQETLKEGGIIAINSFLPHATSSTNGAITLTFQAVNAEDFKGRAINIDSYLYPNEDYSDIKKILANMIRTNEKNPPYCKLILQSLWLNLKYALLSSYSEIKEEITDPFKYIDKLHDVLEYIQNNFTKEITLQNTAEKFYYSPSYLSRTFEKTIGVTFKKYLDNLRLNYAVNLLTSTDKSMDDIALESGFANTRSFVTLHKERYDCLPSEHRNKVQKKETQRRKENENYMRIPQTEYISKLTKYLDDNETSLPIQENKKIVESEVIYADSSLEQGTLKHTFKTFCTVGRASDLLRQNVREMLIEFQSEIRFQYIKFHGILDDDLGVYVKTADNRVVINYDAIDNIVDFLLSINLKPLMQLSFMPKALAKYPNKTTFFRPIITSEPSSLEEWSSFIKGLVSHLLSRYGVENVSSWLFCVWNEAESPTTLFGFKDTPFAPFYQATYKACKEICPTIKFGTTSMLTISFFNSYLEKTYLSDPDCIPDFINIHYYPISSNLILTEQMNAASVKLTSNPYIMSEDIAKIKQKLNDLHLSHLPIYLTEWNSTTSHRDLLNDTALKGAYVAMNLIDNYDKLDSYGYWSLTDDILELPLEDKLFHGGIGLFTKSGIKKTPYYAYSFLSQIGDTLIAKGRNYIITKDIRGFQIVLVNYIHYNDLYANGEILNSSLEDRYANMREEKQKQMNILIDHAVTGKYIIEEFIVNREHGSCYDIWHDNFNNIEPITPESMNALKYNSNPQYRVSSTYIDNGQLNLNCLLEPYEIRLIKIKRL